MTTRTNDDLFAESTMTFGEHIEELRGALFKAIAGLFIGFLLGCAIANQVVAWIQVPVLEALEDYERTHASNVLEEQYEGQPVPPEIKRMLDAGYVPHEKMLIEPFGFLEQLQQDYPDQFPFDFTPHKFIPADIRAHESGIFGAVDPAKALAAKLTEDGAASEDSPGKQMFRRLSASQKEHLKQLAKAKTSTDDDRTQLAAMFNELVEDPSLHESKPFQAIDSFGDTVTKEGVEKLRTHHTEQGDDIDAGDSRRLNRLLIATYLEDFVRPPRVNVVELPTWKPIKKKGLQALRAEEAFMIWIKAALVAGLIISSPWIFYQIWIFVAAGLYPHEKNYVFLYLPVSLGLFLAGALLAFFFVFKPVLSFLFSFNEMMNIDPDLRIGEWLGFVLFLPIGFGISFQLPLVMLFLNRIGIVSLDMYIEKWRIAILIIFVLSMFLTPADPVSMMLMAGPLTILYFGGIGMCKWMPRGRNPFDEAYEPS